MEARQPSRK